MSDLYDTRTARGGHTIPRILAAFPIACFTCALFTDVAYVQTANFLWADFSAWLLAAGMAGGVVAALAGIVSWLIRRSDHPRRDVWPVALGSLLVLGIGFLNNLVHSRDAWTSVMPTGLALSIATVLLMLATAGLASSAGRRPGMARPAVGVRS